MNQRTMRTNLLFVYGTLMKGYGENWQARAGARLVGRGRIIGKLYDLGEFPGAVAGSKFRSHIHGEVYRLDNVERATALLDEYEEFQPSRPLRSLFVRRELPVTMEDGTRRLAWVYVYNRPVRESALIPSGDYRERMSSES